MRNAKAQPHQRDLRSGLENLEPLAACAAARNIITEAPHCGRLLTFVQVACAGYSRVGRFVLC
jgi:hypothetical protein